MDPISLASEHTRNKYILIATDYCTKWVEVWALPDNIARSMAKWLFKDIFTRFGTPIELVSDRGTHFVNKVIKEMTSFFLIVHKKFSPTIRRRMDLQNPPTKSFVGCSPS